MILSIKHQESYSRIELLLRTFFGWLYIYLPHGFILFFIGIWSFILTFISFFVILFTGKYPESFFKFQRGFHQWGLRLSATIFNLTDGYPQFGINATDEKVILDIQNPEKLSRGLLILKVFFGILYVGIPHGFILIFRYIATFFIAFLSFWTILIAGKLPASFHSFMTGTLRWNTRVSLYISFMTDEYPPFSGK